MNGALHTESRRRFRREWLAAGGTIEDVHRTGEERYRHPLCAHPIRTNKRRKDVPAKLLSCINAMRISAIADARFSLNADGTSV